MNIFQKWRVASRRYRAKKAIRHYNAALQSLAEAAEEIGEITRELGNSTAEIENAIKGMQELAKTSLISNKDFEGS